MNIKDRLGTYEECTIGDTIPYKAYIPSSLPFSPGVQIEEILPALEKATLVLGRLDSLTLLFPNAHQFIYTYVRKEAVLSSQIEGTQSSLSDLFSHEIEIEQEEGEPLPKGVLFDDVREVVNYVRAMEHGIRRMKEGFPLSLRLIKEIHEKLMAKGRGKEQNPGEFRTSPVWIGGTRPSSAEFVPPPANKLSDCLNNFEDFLHQKSVSSLIKIALVHAQFETIHPFLDGNGRIGRLLITLLLYQEKIQTSPLLYLSLYFKNHRRQYYECLQETRETGNWEKWVLFFLEGVAHTANEAITTAQKILALFKEDEEDLKDSGASTLLVHKAFQQKPLWTISKLAIEVKKEPVTVSRVLSTLEDKKIIREITGKQRNKKYIYTQYYNILNTEIGG